LDAESPNIFSKQEYSQDFNELPPREHGVEFKGSNHPEKRKQFGVQFQLLAEDSRADFCEISAVAFYVAVLLLDTFVKKAFEESHEQLLL
jgi:hypothetical protein